jgi:hypothetical protein
LRLSGSQPYAADRYCACSNCASPNKHRPPRKLPAVQPLSIQRLRHVLVQWVPPFQMAQLLAHFVSRLALRIAPKKSFECRRIAAGYGLLKGLLTVNQCRS